MRRCRSKTCGAVALAEVAHSYQLKYPQCWHVLVRRSRNSTGRPEMICRPVNPPCHMKWMPSVLQLSNQSRPSVRNAISKARLRGLRKLTRVRDGDTGVVTKTHIVERRHTGHAAAVHSGYESYIMELNTAHRMDEHQFATPRKSDRYRASVRSWLLSARPDNRSPQCSQ